MKRECKSGRDSFHCDALSQIWFVVLAICGEEILSVFFLSRGAFEPVVVMRWAEARITARFGDEALIVQLRAEIAGVNVGGHFSRVAGCAQETPNEFIHSDRFRTGNLDCTIHRLSEGDVS